MYGLGLIFIILLPFLQNCAKPTATVFEDNRLSQAERVKICLLGDVGKDTPHQQIIADALEKEECNRIFFLGDLVYPEGIKSIDDPELERRFLAYYEPILERNPELIINLILGNHDHKGEAAAWKKIDEVHEGFFFPNYYYLIDYGGLCMVALDTSFYYYTSSVVESAQQAVWLTQLDSRLKDCEVKVAMTHHPLRGDDYAGSKDWNGATGPLKAFIETYIIGKFDMHIAGHVHILANDGKDDGTRLLISGTGGEILGGGRPGFVVLNWEPNNPKRIGYGFRYVDTELNVYSEDLQAQQRHEAEEKGVNEYVIDKEKVDTRPWYRRIMDIF